MVCYLLSSFFITRQICRHLFQYFPADREFFLGNVSGKKFFYIADIAKDVLPHPFGLLRGHQLL